MTRFDEGGNGGQQRGRNASIRLLQKSPNAPLAAARNDAVPPTLCQYQPKPNLLVKVAGVHLGMPKIQEIFSV
jgi:hypothetical protein